MALLPLLSWLMRSLLLVSVVVSCARAQCAHATNINIAARKRIKIFKVSETYTNRLKYID